MRTVYAAIGISVSLMLGSPAILSAQDAGWQTRGMFGDRTLGRSLSPAPAQRVPGLQTGPSGNFMGIGRPDGSSMFSTPWRRIEPAPVFIPAVLPGGYPNAIAPAAPVEAPSQPALPEQGMPSEIAPGAEGVQGESAGGAGAGGAPSAAFGGATLPAIKWSLAGSAGATVAARTESYRVNPELSARMTRIAQMKGVGTPAGITVALGDRTAVLRGVVTSPHAREMLANVARLEPGIWQVDNRLSVQP